MLFTKNLIIGLGGTGQQILLEAKSSMMSHCGEVPKGIRFLAIDTDVPDEKVINPYTQMEVKFEGSEFLRLSGNGAINVAKEAEGTWWPQGCTDWPLPGAGAAAKRLHGRAKLGLNINNVDRVIREAVSSVRTISDDGPDVNREGKIRVFIACSLAGGTGSGCWLDIANLLREELKESDRLVSLMLLGDAFEGKPGTTNKYANTIASLKELQWLLSEGVPDSSPYKNYNLYHREMKFSDVKMFNSCFLASKTGPYGVTDEPDAINRALGRWVYQMCGPAGEAFDRREDNNPDPFPYTQPGKGDQDARKGVFWSCGISELVYEGASERTRAAEDAALKIIDELIAGTPMGGEQESIDIPEFLRRNNLQEDSEDQVIDFLWQPRERDAQCSKLKVPSDHNELTRDFHEMAFRKWKTSCERWPTTARGKAQQKKAELEQAAKAILLKKRNSLLSKPGGVSRAELFFADLVREFRNLEQMMEQEAFSDKELSTKRMRQAKGFYDAPLSLGMFSWRKEVSNLLDSMLPLFKDALKFAFENERKKVASELYHELNNYTKDIYDSVLSLKRNLTDTKEKIRTIGRQRSRGLRSNFRRDLPATSVHGDLGGDSIPERVSAHLKDELREEWLAPDIEIDEIKDRIIHVVRGEISDQFEETVFTRVSNMKKEELSSLLQDLYNRSAPMWAFNRGITGQNPDFSTPHSAIVTEGPSELPGEFETLLDAATSDAEPQWCNHEGSNSLSFIQWQHSVPAFAIDSIQSMLPHYKNERLWQQVGVGFHLHGDWRVALPDLEPDSSNTMRKTTWILAHAHGLISEERGSYFVTNTAEEGTPTDSNTWRYKLPDRAYQDARASFLANRQLCDNLSDMLTDLRYTDGKNSFYEEVAAFRPDFARRLGSGPLTERQKALQDDLEILNRWLEENKEDSES